MRIVSVSGKNKNSNDLTN